MFSIKISVNGQPSIKRDTVALHSAAGKCHGMPRNGGRYDLTPKRGNTVHAIAHYVRKAYPEVKVRRSSKRVSVSPPATLVAAYERLEHAWQAMAAVNTPHRTMRLKMINHPAYTTGQ